MTEKLRMLVMELVIFALSLPVVYLLPLPLGLASSMLIAWATVHFMFKWVNGRS